MQPYLRAARSNTIATLQFAVPVAIGIAAELGTQNQRVNRTVSGAILFFTGVYLFALGAKRTLDASIISARTNRSATINKTLNMGLILLGLTTLMYGMYQGLSALFEETPCEYVDRSIPCEVRLEQLKARMVSCPEGLKLWEEVHQEGPVKMLCSTYQEMRNETAVTYAYSREIHFAADVPRFYDDKTIPDYIFEFFNMRQAKKTLDVQSRFCSYTPKGYAEAINRIEYASNRALAKAIETCVPLKKWPESWGYYVELFKDGKFSTFEKYAAYLEEQGKSTIYYQNWQIACHPMYGFHPKNQFYKAPKT